MAARRKKVGKRWRRSGRFLLFLILVVVAALPLEPGHRIVSWINDPRDPTDEASPTERRGPTVPTLQTPPAVAVGDKTASVATDQPVVSAVAAPQTSISVPASPSDPLPPTTPVPPTAPVPPTTAAAPTTPVPSTTPVPPTGSALPLPRDVMSPPRPAKREATLPPIPAVEPNACGGTKVLPGKPGHPCDNVSKQDQDWCKDEIIECDGPDALKCENIDNDADDDGHSVGDIECYGDCDDSDPARFPGNPEVLDGKDNDCNGLVDDGIADDLEEPGDDRAAGATALGGVTIDDCGGKTVTVRGYTLSQRADGSVDPGDWFSVALGDRVLCAGLQPWVRFTGDSGEGFRLCAYPRCGDGARLRGGQACAKGRAVSDGPPRVDASGQGCCCEGAGCMVKIEDVRCDPALGSNARLYVHVTHAGGVPSPKSGKPYGLKIGGD